jgi:hypothetical protein
MWEALVRARFGGGLGAAMRGSIKRRVLVAAPRGTIPTVSTILQSTHSETCRGNVGSLTLFIVSRI